jgi:hypothetical protein
MAQTLLELRQAADAGAPPSLQALAEQTRANALAALPRLRPLVAAAAA